MAFDAWYTRDRSAGWRIDSWETANELLSYLEPERRSFAAFTRSDGSYVQCAGAKTRLTVEARVARSDGTFLHVVFGKGGVVGERQSIPCSVGPIEVDRSQVLKMRDARLIIREFVESGRLHAGYVAEDVTARFGRQ